MNGEYVNPHEYEAVPEPDYDPWAHREMVEASGDNNELLQLHTDVLALDARYQRTLSDPEYYSPVEVAKAWGALEAKRQARDQLSLDLILEQQSAPPGHEPPQE